MLCGEIGKHLSIEQVCKYVCLGEQLAQCIDYLLATSWIEKPVMYDRYFKIGYVNAYKLSLRPS